MKNLWTYIDAKAWKDETKYVVISMILGTLAGLAGFVLWFIIRSWALSSWDWMVCFIGYPFVITWLYVFLYSGRYNLHDGSAVQNDSIRIRDQKTGRDVRIRGQKTLAMPFSK